ncbi:protein NRT1/ PTR FAMILY 4.5-like [Telopea speciosissima]|uniref:protein NRT1/ PTR FAMILY 4.5-like n=1 Tax=Telopea speciosissima TaxID=54955 RepID=UPI001CC49B01|nr:protein NRT1/ PTR FAMILY 4.5-like [Telopea speciosissima]
MPDSIISLTPNIMAVQVYMDWKGKPINKEKHGGAKAALFICFMVVMTNMSYAPTFLNLVTYLRGTMHMDVATASTTVTNFFGATCAFALLGGFISDSYITRFKTLLLFAPLVFLGFVMLTFQAYLPSLRPPACDSSTSGGQQSSSCKQVHGSKAAVLYIALYIIALGEGSLRANLPPFGAEQFDDDAISKSRRKSSYFNWLNVCISGGSVMGLILIVWIESSKGWVEGLALTSGVMLLGLIVFAFGFKLYRHQIPRGSPLTRMFQVFVAAFKKRNLPLPENMETELLYKGPPDEEMMMIGEILPHTQSLRFLDKASILVDGGPTGNWSLCTVTQVEETKVVLRMLPIFLSALLAYIPIPQLLTFTIQQGGTMNNKLGNINVSPVSLVTIPIFFQTMLLVFYDRLFVPLASKITGHRTGITHLQRIGVGFIIVSLAATTAALIEKKRKSIAEEHGLLIINSSGAADHHVPMSVLWLGLQFFAIVIIDVFTYVGLLEFFNSEASKGMKSLGTAIFWCILGLASLLGSTLVELVNKYTRHGRGIGEQGWLGGNNLNHNHLDRFYWLLAILGLVGFFNYLFWATKYVHRKTNVDLSS